MPRQLWLLRHGEAEPHGARPDAERKLTAKGRRQSTAAGQLLARLGVHFDAVYTSPRIRALETAQLACEALELEPIVHEPLSSGFGRADAEQLLTALPTHARVLLVGHEPDFSGVAHEFIGGRVDIKKGGIAAVRIATGEGRLLVLLRPGEIELLSGLR